MDLDNPSDQDVEDWFAAMARASQERQEAAERLAASTPDVLVLCRKRADGVVQGVMVSPSPDSPGRWRVTWFDEGGFFGDGTRNTKLDCVNEAMREGFKDTNRELLRQYMKLDSFHAGNAMTEEIAKWNAGIR